MMDKWWTVTEFDVGRELANPDYVAQLEAEVQRLEKLAKYADHADYCNYIIHFAECIKPCSCGFDDALKEGG